MTTDWTRNSGSSCRATTLASERHPVTSQPEQVRELHHDQRAPVAPATCAVRRAPTDWSTEPTP